MTSAVEPTGAAAVHRESVAASRAAAAVDGLTEYQGTSLSGGGAVLAGVLAATAALGALWWAGALPLGFAGLAVPAEAPGGDGAQARLWGAVMLLAAVVVLSVGGLTRGRPGTVWLLTRYGAYRGTVRRTGLLWINPLLGRRRMDVRLRHWRSPVIEAVDADGARLRVTLLVVWRIRDTARAGFVVDDHERYLREQVESAVALVLSRLPADDFRGDRRTLRDTEHVGDLLTRVLIREMRPVGVAVVSVRPLGIDYAPALADAMRRRQLAVMDARHRQAALDDVAAAVVGMVGSLAERGLADLDGPERTALVKDLTVAFCSTRARLGR